MITKCYYSCYKKDLAFEIYSRRQSDHLESFVGLGGSQAGLVLLFRHLARSFSRSNGTLVFGLNDLAKDFRGHKKDSMVDVCRSIFTSSFGFGGWSDWNFSSLPGIVPYHPDNFHVLNRSAQKSDFAEFLLHKVLKTLNRSALQNLRIQ